MVLLNILAPAIACFIAGVSSLPTADIQERASKCTPGTYRLKLYYENQNDRMAWNGRYVYNYGYALGSTTDVSSAAYFFVNGGAMLQIANTAEDVACSTVKPYHDTPQNATAIFPSPGDCQAAGNYVIQCTETPLYVLCVNYYQTVLQQSNPYFSLNEEAVPGFGPPVSLFIDRC